MTSVATAPPREVTVSDARGRTWRLVALLAIYVAVGHVLPAPVGVDPSGWRLTAVFLATIAGLMLQPLPGAAIVLMGLTACVAVSGLPLARVLSGFSSPPVWLVLCAMMLSRVLRETGLSRRIALFFVRAVGRTSLGVSYALMMTDVTLASGIPSITARSAGIVLPIARSIAELYDSKPGASARLLGTFLMSSLYQSSAIACAMFLTGQASNVFAVGLAEKIAGVHITWSSWMIAGLMPGLASCLAIPYLVYRMVPPDVRRTPGAAEYATRELEKMGRPAAPERIVAVVFGSVCALWITSGWHGLDVTFVVLGALAVLFVAGVLTWEGVLAERSAWDVFVWYGGLVAMGDILNETGSTRAFATWVGGWFTGIPWFAVLLITLVIYFYAHYAFASITTHVLAMFPAFTALLIGLGTPPLLAVYAFACLANLTAGLTHYGTTTAPIVFNEGYVSLSDWWRVGFAASVVNIAIWLTIGFGWWKLLGFW